MQSSSLAKSSMICIALQNRRVIALISPAKVANRLAREAHEIGLAMSLDLIRVFKSIIKNPNFENLLFKIMLNPKDSGMIVNEVK